MPPGVGVKQPVPRTRTGCLTCRKRKVKCDELKPVCGKCARLQRQCVWGDEMQVRPRQQQYGALASTLSKPGTIQLNRPSGQSFVVEFPNVDKWTMQYIHHFITFCCRFLVYPNDSEGNPFQDQLVPLAVSNPALLHSMIALSASHLTRSQGQHDLAAAKHYSLALRELNATLSDPKTAKSDSTLGACLLLCVYEISHSENGLWLQHLQGARDLILYRGGPRTTDYLSRFFSLLDVSGSVFAGGGTLLKGNYWLEDALPALPESSKKEQKSSIPSWPAYDPEGSNSNHFHQLMVFMATMSRLSSDSMSDEADQVQVRHDTMRLKDDLSAWWQHCPPKLRDQSFDWRRQVRPVKLTVPETLEEEGISSITSCMYGCVIYLNHILDPLIREPQKPEVTEAIHAICSIAKETPEGYGLEMGLYFGLFMAGVAVFNDLEVENLLRQKLKADTRVSIYHADRALELLEVLWGRQHQYGVKYDWRQVQIQMGIQVYVFC